MLRFFTPIFRLHVHSSLSETHVQTQSFIPADNNCCYLSAIVQFEVTIVINFIYSPISLRKAICYVFIIQHPFMLIFCHSMSQLHCWIYQCSETSGLTGSFDLLFVLRLSSLWCRLLNLSSKKLQEMCITVACQQGVVEHHFDLTLRSKIHICSFQLSIPIQGARCRVNLVARTPLNKAGTEPVCDSCYGYQFSPLFTPTSSVIPE